MNLTKKKFLSIMNLSPIEKVELVGAVCTASTGSLPEKSSNKPAKQSYFHRVKMSRWYVVIGRTNAV